MISVLRAVKRDKIQLAKSLNGKYSPTEEAVIAYNAKRISECVPDQIMGALSYCMYLIGQTEKDALQKEEAAVLYDFVIKEFGIHYSLEDIKLAFRWGVSGRIQIDRSLYGKRFSASYITKYLQAYVPKRNELLVNNSELLKRELLEEQNKMLLLPEHVKSQEQEDLEWLDMISKIVIREQAIPPGFNTDSVFNALVIKGIIKPEAQENSQARAMKEILKEIDEMRLRGRDSWEIRNKTLELNAKESINRYARRIACIDYFKTLITPKEPVKKAKQKK